MTFNLDSPTTVLISIVAALGGSVAIIGLAFISFVALRGALLNWGPSLASRFAGGDQYQAAYDDELFDQVLSGEAAADGTYSDDDWILSGTSDGVAWEERGTGSIPQSVEDSGDSDDIGYDDSYEYYDTSLDGTRGIDGNR